MLLAARGSSHAHWPNLEGADQGTLSPHELSIFATRNHVETKLFNKNSQLYPAAWGRQVSCGCLQSMPESR
jgi:hypothetical protein